MAGVYPGVSEGGVREAGWMSGPGLVFPLHSTGKQPQEPVCSQKLQTFLPPIQVSSLGSGPSDNSRSQVYWHHVTNSSFINPKPRALRMPLQGRKAGGLDTYPPAHKL